MEADKSKMDVLDFVITMLKDHERKICGAAEVLEQVAKHSLDAEKLYKMEEFIVFRKTEYGEGKVLDVHIPASQIIEDLDKLLEIIRK